MAKLHQHKVYLYVLSCLDMCKGMNCNSVFNFYKFSSNIENIYFYVDEKINKLSSYFTKHGPIPVLAGSD